MPKLMQRAPTLDDLLAAATTDTERAAIQARRSHADDATTDERHVLDGLIVDGVDSGAVVRAERRALLEEARRREKEQGRR